MNITITGRGNTGMRRSILHDMYKIDKQQYGYENTFTNYKVVSEENSVYLDGNGWSHEDFVICNRAKETDKPSSGMNFDGIELKFTAEIQANGKYNASLYLSYEELETLQLTKTAVKYIEINDKLEEEKDDLEYEIRKLEREMEDLKEKVKKFDEIKEKMNE
tara:strand:+ start:74 stop:559 length:486 start_codon:yes stop_codon:yes gene_type:complete